MRAVIPAERLICSIHRTAMVSRKWSQHERTSSSCTARCTSGPSLGRNCRIGAVVEPALATAAVCMGEVRAVAAAVPVETGEVPRAFVAELAAAHDDSSLHRGWATRRHSRGAGRLSATEALHRCYR